MESIKGYLNTTEKSECYGCESCAQICPKKAISMKEDEEGFRYPIVNEELCIHCGLCNSACPYEHMPMKYTNEKYAFGGYINNDRVKEQSTSGGAFSAIVDSWCDKDYVVFGAEARGLEVYHTYINDKNELYRFRKSKYSQSHMGNSYVECKKFLLDGKKVLFSGTPCHIAGLRAFLNNTDQTNLLTVEVICEGVPSPFYVRKYAKWCQKKYNSSIEELDYRYKDGKKWDFEVMLTKLHGGILVKIDRWFNPFWSIWLNHLISRPSCYKCPFTTKERGADITLGDLWGVHLYCPELYGRNGGASLVVCNTVNGKEAFTKAETLMYGHELDFDTALKYQSPMRKPIEYNPDREACIADLQGEMHYKAINKKWAKKPTVKLLCQKYVWGNRQKVFFWNLKCKLRRYKKEENNA